MPNFTELSIRLQGDALGLNTARDLELGMFSDWGVDVWTNEGEGNSAYFYVELQNMGMMKELGPGLWRSIHTTGAWAETIERHIFFCQWVRLQIASLPCEECTDDSNYYMSFFPPEEADHPFVWTWAFHNYVNHKLGKPEMLYEEARDMYIGNQVKCAKFCG